MFTADISNAIDFSSMMTKLDITMNTDQHTDAVARASFDYLSAAFDADTAHMAAADIGSFHHVYEWDHVGQEPFKLWKNVLTGRGRNREISWSWRASKTTVPTEHDVFGGPKYADSKGFDASKLHRVHVYVWKAPMMEYGMDVTVKPIISAKLVLPGNPRPVFTSNPVEISGAGRQTVGKFTAWFQEWWRELSGPKIAQLEAMQTDAFVRAFEQETQGKYKSASRTVTFTTNANAAAIKTAEAIANRAGNNYIAQAAARRSLIGELDYE